MKAMRCVDLSFVAFFQVCQNQCATPIVMELLMNLSQFFIDS